MSGADGERHWSDDVAAYLLGALEPEEAAALEAHLEGCERCRSQLRWLAPAIRSLPESVERLDPPRELRGRLMGEVRADARASAAAEAGAERAGPRLPGWARRLGLGWRPLAGLAALALVAVAVAGYEIGSEDSGGRSGSTMIVVAGHAPGVTAKMVGEGGGGTLQLAHVRRLPDGRVLQAWVRRDGEVEAVPALFVPDRAGRASITIDDMEGVDTVMVTAEPSGGSRAPTSAPLVTMSIPQ